MTTKRKPATKKKKKSAKKSIKIIGLFGKTEKIVTCKHCGSAMTWEDSMDDSKFYECPDCGEMCTVRGKKINWQSDH
jgi:predicted RNA-binding Zn-ribbon protein involved in translation (DUF1610 family)